jgi:hypothetical protein
MLDCLENQVKRLKRTSRLFRITLKDVRRKRFGKLALRNNHNREKNEALANSALGLVYSSRVSKVAGRKAPYWQRQFKTLAKRVDKQNLGSNTMTAPLLPAKVASRRSIIVFLTSSDGCAATHILTSRVLPG